MKGIMQTNCVYFVLLVTLVCVYTVLGNDSLLPPSRPSAFRSPAQLRRYLKALNDYYAIVGRPRFGKRNNDYSLTDQDEVDGFLYSSRDKPDILGPQWW
ncbi:pro-neuropeptide Y-like [Saccostrea echinata]|uniref:pro-neuropeptide Y-like n=1 Tax=Saccostrea echinata TaxID=191078 RepID=UPI002A82F0A4|nr:pro-neuropeptide Y-like [Saccostrea echinata]